MTNNSQPQTQELYMRRCFDLARKGRQSAAPNPVVGSVIVHQGEIIGEGYHKKPGLPHAEVEAIESVKPEDRHRLKESVIYVSLEPCCFYGRTPPCTDLIMRSGIPEVVISRLDPNPKVSGSGVEILENAGIKVTVGVLEEEGTELAQPFIHHMTMQRPYITLKVVQSKDGFIGLPDRQVWLSNSYESVLVHKLRSQMDAIMVGTNTAVVDNPQLTNRFPNGKTPLRVVLDRTLRIPESHHLLSDGNPTLIVTAQDISGRAVSDNISYLLTPFDASLLEAVMYKLHEMEVQSLLIEGGTQLIESFADQNMWDEAWIVRTENMLKEGVRAPVINGKCVQEFRMDGDVLRILKPTSG